MLTGRQVPEARPAGLAAQRARREVDAGANPPRAKALKTGHKERER